MALWYYQARLYYEEQAVWAGQGMTVTHTVTHIIVLRNSEAQVCEYQT